MTQKEFDEALTRALEPARRRYETLLAVKQGKIKLRRVEVKGYRVSAYAVRAHVRYIAPQRGPVAVKKIRKAA